MRHPLACPPCRGDQREVRRDVRAHAPPHLDRGGRGGRSAGLRVGLAARAPRAAPGHGRVALRHPFITARAFGTLDWVSEGRPSSARAPAGCGRGRWRRSSGLTRTPTVRLLVPTCCCSDSHVPASTWSMAPIWAWCDMNEVTGLDRFEPVPDTAGHDVRVAGPQHDLRLDARCTLVTVIEDQFHRSAHDVQELVTVGVDLTTMRSRPVDVGDRSYGVPVDPPRRTGWGRCDGHRPVAGKVRDVPFEADR